MTTGEIFYDPSQIKTNKGWQPQKNFDLRGSWAGVAGWVISVVRPVVRPGGSNESKSVTVAGLG